jgi:leukotriene-A4 hydrolase
MRALLLSMLLAAPAFAAEPTSADDPHSFANLRAFRTTHAALDLRADFERRQLVGHVDLTLERIADARELILDTRDLTIRKVELLGAPAVALQFRLGARDAILGTPLHIEWPSQNAARTAVVRVTYETSPEASGLQWLTPAQTAGKQQPFVYSQSQAVHARSWIPLQDTPRVRLTYAARIRTPPSLVAVMSADNDPKALRDGDYAFRMPQRIPSYLFALAIGDLAFKSLGPRTGVYAEPAQIEAAAHEFADVESMLQSCEKLFGPYRWGRYDLLILPPSFMWGGMENPRLSFITPTVIAGDRSLVSLIAHELAHSWSGNLVTNADWGSAWLNEGFTTYLERRIVEALYGAQRRAMEDVLGLQSLQRDMADLQSKGDGALTRLAVDLRGRDPDDGFSDVPYEKGRLFIGFLEARLGRARLDAFLREYFSRFAFQSVSTATFVDYLTEHVLRRPGAGVTLAEVQAWIDQPGLPPTAVLPQSDAFTAVDGQRSAWLNGKLAVKELKSSNWTTHEWLHFLDNLPPDISSQRLRELDAELSLTKATNNEIAHSWLKSAIRAGYAPAYPRLEQYLASIGRRKLVKDLYEELMKTPAGAALARRVYPQARPLYQIPLAEQLDKVVR